MPRNLFPDQDFCKLLPAGGGRRVCLPAAALCSFSVQPGRGGTLRPEVPAGLVTAGSRQEKPQPHWHSEGRVLLFFGLHQGERKARRQTSYLGYFACTTTCLHIPSPKGNLARFDSSLGKATSGLAGGPVPFPLAGEIFASGEPAALPHSPGDRDHFCFGAGVRELCVPWEGFVCTSLTGGDRKEARARFTSAVPEE